VRAPGVRRARHTHGDAALTRAAVIAGLGVDLPAGVVTNEMLAQRLDTSHEWIHSRTGIAQRHVVAPGVATSDLAVGAGARALRSAGVSEVEMVVLATATPDHPVPATAPAVAARLGLGPVAAYDVSAVCSGFVYALASGAGAIAAGLADSVLVIGAEAFTTIVDPSDRATASIFGDGAGAVVLRAGDRSEPGALLGFDLGSDGALADLIWVAAGGSRRREPESRADRFFAMEGRSVFKHAVTRMTQSSRAVLARTGWAVGDVDRLVGHQANARILYAVAEQLEVPRERAVVALERVGNTSAASIPLALADSGARRGDRLLLTAFGGGAAWGSATLTWPELEVAR
jgi:3-oxoacyl-[acyl-carrier-protein] synthase-3